LVVLDDSIKCAIEHRAWQVPAESDSLRSGCNTETIAATNSRADEMVDCRMEFRLYTLTRSKQAMLNVFARMFLRIGLSVVAILIAVPARASQIQITVTNDQPAGGFTLAPVWFGVQNGTFNSFTPGSSASSAIATLAQFGNTGPLMTLFESQNVGVDTTLTSGGSLVQFVPGQSNSTILNVSNPSVDKFLSYAGMVVPSNDFFQGNATPLRIFNSSGSFVGPITIQVFGSSIWDSDTEAQSTTTALTFIQGQTPGTGTQIMNGRITTVLPNSEAFLNSIDGLSTAAGYQISHIPTGSDLIATIQINSVPQPASIALLGVGVIGLAVVSRSSGVRKPHER
jgi:PEP-CTERM motif